MVEQIKEKTLYRAVRLNPKFDDWDDILIYPNGDPKLTSTLAKMNFSESSFVRLANANEVKYFTEVYNNLYGTDAYTRVIPFNHYAFEMFLSDDKYLKKAIGLSVEKIKSMLN